MTTSARRGRQLLALALASTTVVVAAGASAASAAPTGTSTTSSLYSGSADSSTVQLVVTLPSALDAITGLASSVLPNPIDLSLIRSTGLVSHDGSTADVATSKEDLAQSSLLTSSALSALLAPVLSHTVTSTLAAPKPAAFTLASVPANPLGLNLALTPLTAATDTGSKATNAAGGVATSSLASLSTLAPSLTQPLQAALTTVNTQLASALAALTTAIAPVTSTAASTVQTLTSALSAIPTITVPATPLTPQVSVNLSSILGSALNPTNLVNTLNQVPALLSKVEDELLNGAAVSLDGISSSENVVPSGAGTTSTAAANVATINLFGGLIQVQATKASASASAPGTSGKAQAASTATLLKVQVGQDLDNILTVLADDSGLTAGILGGVDPSVNAALSQILGTVNSAVASVLSTVTGLLQSLNSNAKILQQGTATHSVSADGTHAEAAATPAEISLGLPGASNLIALSLGNVSVVANNEVKTVAPAVVKAPTVAKVPGQAAKPVAPTKKLAYTGADLPLTAGAALVLLGAAAGVARRRRHTA